MNKPAAIRSGDQIVLGGAVKMTIEIVSDEAASAVNSNDTADGFSNHQTTNDSVSSEPSAVWQNLFFIAPVCAVVILLFVGGLFFALSGSKPEPKIVAQRNIDVDDETVSTRRETNRKTANEDEPEDEPTASKTATKNENSSSRAETNAGGASENNSGGAISSEQETVEKNALQFLRSISSDSNPVLTGKQLSLINAKIKILKNSAALRGNLAAAKRGATSFQSIARAQNLKPMLVAAAALTRLNESRGEPTAAANSIAPDLGKFGNVLGTELANDCLLVIVANEEGGSNLALRDKLANLAKQQQTASAATVRTIWFLHDNDKISGAAFDFAVRFIAMGAIAQNPKDFGVDAEPLNF